MIKVTVVDEAETALEGKELEKLVDLDLDSFAEFFCKALNNSQLSGPERAIVKTWLYWKFHEADLRVKYNLP
jgi:hypothetical protein